MSSSSELIPISRGYVYQWTHVSTGAWYIGSHNGSKPGYRGSGIRLRNAMKAHGVEEFVNQIIYVGPYFREMEERILTALDAKNDPCSYNLKNEAWGCSLPGQLNPMHSSNGYVDSFETRRKKGSAFRGKTRPDHSARMSGSGNPMYGRADQAKAWVAWGKSTAGKTLEEIYGQERGEELRLKRQRPLKKPHNWRELTCPYCQKTGRGPNMGRYHFDNCKQK